MERACDAGASAEPGVSSVVGHACRFGVRVPRQGKAQGSSGLARKPTSWAKLALELLRRLGAKCSNEGRSSSDPQRHQYAPLVGRLPSGESRVARAAACPPALCVAVLR
eukprot:3799717-Alexandrium_andersonii.AAC.1